MLLGEDTIRLGAIWDSRIVPYNSDQYFQLSAENWKGITCTFYSSLYVALSCELYLYRVINLSSSGNCPSLGTTSMYVLETISRVGAIVELTLLAPRLRNPYSAAWHWM